MLRLFGFLLLGLLCAGGILFVDFNRMIKEASAAEAAPPTLEAYLQTVPEKLASLTSPFRTSTAVLDLPDMMPRAPEGWTTRPLAPGDIEGFLPRSSDTADPEMVTLVTAIGSTSLEPGATVAIQAYERGERLVVVRLVRLPDGIFTEPAEFERRYDLQVAASKLRGRPFLTVRGLDVTEEFLGEGMRARYFSADVGAQIQLRILGSRRLKDADLVPFFETLNVQAMNAAVVDRQPGLGEVPVLVLGATLNEADLAAYEADRSARAATAIAQARGLRDLAKAEMAATAEAAGATPAKGAKPLSSECRNDSGGIKRCSVTSGADG